MTAVTRCPWCGEHPEYRRYHDEEWGVPSFDETHLFEMLLLEGAQAGLNWLTILRRRQAYREAFSNYDIATIAHHSDADQARLMTDSGIIRNRRKVQSAVGNAQATLNLHDSGSCLRDELWQFVDGVPIRNAWRTMTEVPALTTESKAMSHHLKQLGFSFVGPTICYALMQAVGMVNDHLVGCFRHDEV